MRWPGRKGAGATPQAEAPAPLTAPERAWATLPPPARAIGAPALTADPGRFTQRLAAWEQTGVTRQGVGHLRTEDAPVGQVHGLVRVLADQPAPSAASSPPVTATPSDPLPVARRDLTVAPDPPSPQRALAVLPTERPSRPADSAEPNGAGPTSDSSTIGSATASGTPPVVQPLSTAPPVPAPAPAHEPTRLVLSGEAGQAARPGATTDPGATSGVSEAGTPGPSSSPPSTSAPLAASPAPGSAPSAGGDRPAPPPAIGATVQAMPLSPAPAGLPSPSPRRAGLGAPLPSGTTAPAPPGPPPPAPGPGRPGAAPAPGPGPGPGPAAPTPGGPDAPPPGPSPGTGSPLEGASPGPPASTSTPGPPPPGTALPPGGTSGLSAVQRHPGPGDHDDPPDGTPADLPLNRLPSSHLTVQTEPAGSAAAGSGGPSAGSGDASLPGPGPSSVGADGANPGTASRTGSGPGDSTRPVLPLSTQHLATGTPPTTLNAGTTPAGALAAEPVGPLQRSPAGGAPPSAGPPSDHRGQPVEPGPSSGADESVRPTLGAQDLGPPARSLLGEPAPAPGGSDQPPGPAVGPTGGAQRHHGGPTTVLRQPNGPVAPTVGAGGGRPSSPAQSVRPWVAIGEVSVGPRGSTGPAPASGLPPGVQRAAGPPGPTQPSPSPNDRGALDTAAGGRTPLTLSPVGARPTTVVSRSAEPPPAAAVAEPAPAVPPGTALVAADAPAVQREEQAPPPPAQAPASAGPAAATAPAPTTSPMSTLSPAELDELSRKLYDRLRGRLSAELRIDRERTGSLIEPSF